MFSARPAEWLIARFAGERQAASIVGDLLEDASERGPEWFWFSVAGIVLSLTRRYLLALAVGLICYRVLPVVIGEVLIRSGILRSLPAPVFGPGPEPSGSWWPFFAGLDRICLLLWIVVPYAAVRFGFRDRFVQLAFSVCLILSTACICWQIPGVFVASVGVTALLVIMCLALASLRKLLLSVSLALVLGYIGTQFAFVLGAKYLEWMLPSISHSEQAQYLGILLSAVSIAAACELMHRLFCCSAQGSSTTEQSSFSE